MPTRSASLRNIREELSSKMSYEKREGELGVIELVVDGLSCGDCIYWFVLVAPRKERIPTWSLISRDMP